MRDLAVLVHAVAATVALAAGIRAMPAGRGYRTYLVTLVVSVLALVPALSTGWSDLQPVLRGVFVALLVLGVVMVAQGVRAGAVLPGIDGPGATWVHRLGFTLVGLVDGFLVVSALRLGAPGWALLVVGVGVAAVGHLALSVYARRSAVARAVG